MTKYALVNEQGTACSETVLCEKHNIPINRVIAENEASKDVVPNSWTDCSKNDACFCIICGK